MSLCECLSDNIGVWFRNNNKKKVDSQLVPLTDRQLHCPRLTWQTAAVHSDHLVPGLFICYQWERSWGEQIAFAQRDSHRCFEVWASMCVCVCVRSLTRSLALSRTSCTYLCQGKVWILLINGTFRTLVVRQWAVEKFSRERCSKSKQVTVSLALSGSHQLSVEQRCTGLREVHAPAVPVA